MDGSVYFILCFIYFHDSPGQRHDDYIGQQTTHTYLIPLFCRVQLVSRY